MATVTGQARTLVSRAVIWTGLVLGTAVTVLAVTHGVRLPRLEPVLSVLATWALLTVLAVVVVELLRRHHPAIRHHGNAEPSPPLAVPAPAPGRHLQAGHQGADPLGNREHRPLGFRRLARRRRARETRRTDGHST